MDKVLHIAWREFIETVKTRAFLLGAVVMPVLVMGAVFGARWMMERVATQPQPPRTLLVRDRTGQVLEPLQRRVQEHNRERPGQLLIVEPHPGDAQDALEAVRAGRVYGYVEIPPEALSGAAPCSLARKDAQLELGERIERLVNDALIDVRFTRADPPIDRERVEQLQRRVPLVHVDLRSGLQQTGNPFVQAMLPFAFMFLLWMGTMGISQGLLTSVIEEKSSRIVEVLLSAVSPGQLMAGKILGMVAVGAVVLTAWGTVGYQSAKAQQLTQMVTPQILALLALYFVPGFLLSAALLAAMGSACNTLKEAQGMAFPLSLVTMIPVFFWLPLSQHPDSLFAVLLSYVPPITPFIMVLRLTAGPDTPVWQIVTTQLLLWVAVAVTVWAAGKIFRVGILMYGKPPTPRELLRWIRYA